MHHKPHRKAFLLVLTGGALIAWVGFASVRQHALNHRLLQAVEKRNSAAAIRLLRAGADPNITESDLSLAEMLQCWLARLLHRPPPPDLQGDAVLLVAINSSDKPMEVIGDQADNILLVGELLRQGADPNVQDKFGSTPLQAAVNQWEEENALALLRAGANPNCHNIVGWTPLHQSSDSPRMTAALLARNTPIDSKDVEGRTPLMSAAQSGNATTVKMLLAHGASPIVTDNAGRNALCYARGSGSAEVVRCLRARQAQPLPNNVHSH